MATPGTTVISDLSVDTLKFDPQNPRLPGSFDATNETEVLKWMLGDASLIELMGSIGEQGYFPGEPLLGVRHQDGSIIIVEGNRRLASAKLLLHPDRAPIKKKSVQKVAAESPNKPSVLPVLIYSNREDILSYLGYRHVTGIKAWDPLAKARYLRELFSLEPDIADDDKFRSLARKIGSRADYVARLLTGYALYEEIESQDFFGIKGLDEETIDFSVLTTAMNYSNISNYLGLKSASDPGLSGLDPNNLKELTEWLFAKNIDGKTRIGESRNLSYLSQIVANEQALKVWRDGSPLDYALSLTETPSDIFKRSVMDSFAYLRTARDYSHKVDKPEETSLDLLRDIKSIAQDLYASMSDKIHI